MRTGIPDSLNEDESDDVLVEVDSSNLLLSMVAMRQADPLIGYN